MWTWNYNVATLNVKKYNLSLIINTFKTNLPFDYKSKNIKNKFKQKYLIK